MGQEVSNEGILGIESIRLGGMTLDNLPIAEGALTKAQMPDIIAADKKNTIDNIIAKYPKQTVAWVRGAIRDCEVTIKNVRGLKVGQNTMINEYSTHIGLCVHRDREVAKLNAENPADLVEIKKLKLQFPPYNVKAMKQQIEQCKEAIERSDIVIDKEHSDIATFKELLTTCMQRDKELAEFGVSVD